MKKYAAAFFLLFPLLAQQERGSRHLLGTNTPLTLPSGRPARDIAADFIRTVVVRELALTDADVMGLYIAKEYKTEHNNVTHLIYMQQFNGVDVYNAEWVVNIDSNGSVLNSGGNLYSAPAPDVVLPSSNSSLAAVRAAVREINPKTGRNFAPMITGSTARTNGITLVGDGVPDGIEGQLVWYGDRGQLKPAWLFYLTSEDGIQRYATVVDDATQGMMALQPLTFFQSPPKGLVFERESPQPNPTPGIRLSSPPPLVDRTPQSFAGDSKASPFGWVIGNQTAGNNAIVGENPLGILFLPTPTITTAPDGVFSFPLQLGPGAPSPLTFTDAANTNLFYWMNRAHDLHYQYGFDEAAGNFQATNFSRTGTDRDPIRAYTHFGAASPGTAQILNAFFTTRAVDDGSDSMVAMFLSQSNNNDFFTDGSFDSIVMVHEYTHGVSTRLVRQGYSTFQGQSMGEAWSDFYALEYTLPSGAPPDGVYPAGEYFDQSWGAGDLRSRPYSTNMDINPLTFANLGHVIFFPEVHADGEIWAEALWEVRATLIAQFGETEGRRRLRTLVMDGMKLSVPAPSMVDMRDAILLADRVDYNGASQTQLWAAFAKRGLGALAYSNGGQTVHVASSFEVPSNAGQLRFLDDPVVFGETARIILQDSTLTQPTVRVQVLSGSGDLEDVLLHKNGSTYVGVIATSPVPGPKENGSLSLATGDYVTAYYTHFGPPGDKQISASVTGQLPYTLIGELPTFAFGAERRLNVTGTYRRIDLPFSFPFFSNTYGSVLVHRNGLLSFELPISTSCTDGVTLGHFNGITPLWANLITTGQAQPREDVYMSQGPDSVTFHWIAETRTPFATPGHPVNFAATLYADGRIDFNYDPKSNQNLNFDATFFGCGLGPIGGISNGHDGFIQAFSFDTANGVSNAFRFDPPFGNSTIPTATLESPVMDQSAQGILQVSGIAYDTQSLVTRIDVYVDGVVRGRTTPGVVRSDFCSGPNATINGCPRVGFSLPLDLVGQNIAPGSHMLSLRVTNSRGGFTDVPPVSFIVTAGESRLPRAQIESPANGTTVSGDITVRGWALADDLRVTSVDILIDGVTYGPTAYGLARTDICNAQTTRPPNCPFVGFTLILSTKDAFPMVLDGQHTMKVRVRDETGRFTVVDDSAVTFTVSNGADAGIVGVLTTPKSNDKLSGTVTLSGYAYSPGHAILAAAVILDSAVVIGTATVNQPAPDVCKGLTVVDACPNIGFTFNFDTTKVLNGLHILGVELLNDAGEFVIIPTVVNGGIDIFVQN